MKLKRIFIRHLTFRKIGNALLIYLSFYLSRFLKQYIHWGKPTSLTLECSSLCNLQCSGCKARKIETASDVGFLPLAKAKKIIQQASPTLLNLSLYFRGEPLLNPETTDIIQYASQNNIFTTLSTNACLIDRKVAEQLIASGLSHIVVSMDGATEETYKKYRRNGSLASVVQSLQLLSTLKKSYLSPTPFITVQLIVSKDNENEIDATRRLAISSGADRFIVKSLWLENPEQEQTSLPTNPKLSRYRKLADGSTQLKSCFPNYCRRSWESMVITANGLALPCCFDKECAYTLGNTESEDVLKIFKNKAFRNFRRQILQNRKHFHICQNCTEGTDEVYPGRLQ